MIRCQAISKLERQLREAKRSRVQGSNAVADRLQGRATHLFFPLKPLHADFVRVHSITRVLMGPNAAGERSMWSRLREVNTPRGAANQALAIVGKAKRLQQISHTVA